METWVLVALVFCALIFLFIGRRAPAVTLGSAILFSLGFLTTFMVPIPTLVDVGRYIVESEAVRRMLLGRVQEAEKVVAGPSDLVGVMIVVAMGIGALLMLRKMMAFLVGLLAGYAVQALYHGII
ncbi:MAG: hypothetical protein JRD89_05210 [Deltaproteobacteria bacterium]|nr:hypothetical protein [Deltaproteobacteria bacterium]